MTVILKEKEPIVVPPAVRRKAGFRSGEEVEFKVSRRAITIVPKQSSDDYPMETVMRIIREQKKNPMTARQLAALDADLAAYAAKRAKEAGIKESDIPRIIHESRARRRRLA